MYVSLEKSNIMDKYKGDEAEKTIQNKSKMKLLSLIEP